MDDLFTIGQVAAETGVEVSTLRFYERKGLIEVPRRNASGYRLYPPEIVSQVRFIKNSRDLGFSLQNVMELLELSSSNLRKADCIGIKNLLKEQHEQVCQQVQQLTAQKARLETLLDACCGFEECEECEVTQILSE
jgi:DNA-binding transcriptional MerR regulator